jgi:hypothetical protein
LNKQPFVKIRIETDQLAEVLGLFSANWRS